MRSSGSVGLLSPHVVTVWKAATGNGEVTTRKMVAQRTSVSEYAYIELRERILHGHFAPGAKLVVRPITEELDLSPTPVKSALAALEKEGLIRVVPNRGYFVETFDAAEVREICAVRGALDRLAAELAASKPDHMDLAERLDRNLVAQRYAVEVGKTDDYADLNHEFHRMIWESCGNRRTAMFLNSIAGQVRLLVNSSARVHGRPGRSLNEHEAIVGAIRTGDGPNAGAYALAHALNSEDTLLDVLAQYGEVEPGQTERSITTPKIT